MSMTPEGRKRFVSDAIKNSKFASQHNTNIEFEEMFMQLNVCINDVQNIIKPILKAGGGFDEAALKPMIYKNLMERMDGFTKDELVAICTSVFADRLLEDVRANPRGNDNPDLLGGK